MQQYCLDQIHLYIFCCKTKSVATPDLSYGFRIFSEEKDHFFSVGIRNEESKIGYFHFALFNTTQYSLLFNDKAATNFKKKVSFPSNC